MGNDFKHLLNPVDQPSTHSTIAHDSFSQYLPLPATSVAAATIVAATTPSRPTSFHETHLPSSGIASGVLSSKDCFAPISGSSESCVNDPADRRYINSTVSVESSLLRSGGSPNRAYPASSSEPHLNQWSQQQSTRHKIVQPQSETFNFLSSEDSSASRAPTFRTDSQSSVHSIPNRVQPTTPPSPSPSPLPSQRSKLPPESPQAFASATSIAGLTGQAQNLASREPRSVRFEDRPRNGPSSPNYSPRSHVGIAKDDVRDQHQVDCSTAALGESRQTSAITVEATSPALTSPNAPYHPASPPNSFSVTMGHPSGSAATGLFEETSNIEQHGAISPAQVSTTTTCPECAALDSTYYTNLSSSVSNLQQQHSVKNTSSIEEFYRRGDRLLQAMRNGGKQTCDACQQQAQRPVGQRIGITIDTRARQRRKSIAMSGESEDRMLQNRKRKRLADGDVDGHPTSPGIRNSSLELSPSPKCQFTPPPEGSATSPNVQYEVRTVDGRELEVPVFVGSHAARALSTPSRANRSIAAIDNSPDNDIYRDTEMKNEKGKQRKDSGPAPIPDGV
ncbi:hypothetical protein BU24DRAFT_185003 [Aaosphaeria arxii CBS 175.79]|uniref:Uncharacterized protein n=1 Tax=Aaosphaeria arxii CBS 175.79 TaxID=1450172 RepID=A0A6A5XU51_9PLEO|nr:uncharacterized protein BU24DRAFT_185003 [Aaosphaeria arxii CBS 175.79]KAF2015774.1 hypothetical protein BU24DRAFT_185003 [Aaosphaeria arxii CBS 175.79]